MKNKQKMWRRLAKKYRDESGDLKRNGRMLRQLTTGHFTRGVGSTQLLDSMLARAGIIVPKAPEVEVPNEAE